MEGRGAKFVLLFVATNLLAACTTVFAVVALYQSYYQRETALVVRRTQECCQCLPVSPVSAPSFACPSEAGSIDIFTDGVVEISNSNGNMLCTLIEITPDGYLKPVGRSYDALDWESSAGDFAVIDFECFSGPCTVDLPILHTGARYQLTSFDTPPYSASDETARFLEQATFGPTLADIASFDTSNLQLSFANWIKTHQTTVPLTSHREYFRRRLNARFEVATPLGAVTHPCQKGTRYRRFAFSAKDLGKILTIQTVETLTVLHLDGFVRTMVEGPAVSVEGGVAFADGSYRICSSPPEHMIGGTVSIENSSLRCVAVSFNSQGGNPSIEFSLEKQPNTLISLQNNQVTPIDQQYIQDAVPAIQELLVTSDLSDPTCSSIAEPGNPIDAVFATYNGEYWIHDPRFELFDNTVESPSPDGGGSVARATANFGNPDYSAICANVPQSFLNVGSCIISSRADACAVGSGHQNKNNVPTFLIPLDHAAMRVLYDESGAGAVGTLYLYAADGLRVEDDTMVPPPCERKARSRWIQVNCSQSSVDPTTETIFANLISYAVESDQNPNVIDVIMTKDFTCPEADEAAVGFTVADLGGQCWRNVHPDHLNVYDFTPWTKSHPGNSQSRNPIKEFAEAGSSTLVFPGWHEMDRWQLNKSRFRKMGRLGDSVDYYAVPESFRTQAFNEAVGFDPETAGAPGSGNEDATSGSSGTLVCGSPNEVANEASMGGSQGRGAFDSWAQYLRTTKDLLLARQKRIVWTQTALNADDQLRQRVAWAIAQIFVVSTDDIGSGARRTEIFMTYYDIFVRNAFGNYRDILKEVSYSPVMADMLTYYGSRSTAFEYGKDGSLKFADENYAREIMQLFTTGLYKLSPNGNKVLDKSGETVQVYTNDDIVEYARVWTGFTGQLTRGNIEIDGSTNRVDPMQINEEWRDRFPKMGLNRKYIGDGVPLCADLPHQHFLSKDATYKLLGRTPMPQLQRDPIEWSQDANVQRLSLQPNGSNSLFAKLCGATSPASCQFAPQVVLNENTPCTGKECPVNTVRTVEVADGIFYEYIRPPCVHQAFYDNAKLVSMRNRKKNVMCADPRTEVASTACCPGGDVTTRFWSDTFWGERSTFATAAQRCNQKLCTQTTRPSCNKDDGAAGFVCAGRDRFWTNTDCVLRVKIDGTGNAAIVHAPADVEDESVEKIVQADTKTFFRVNWNDTSAVNNLISNCSAVSGCSTTVDGMCMCDVSVSEEQVFSDGATPSSEEVLSSLHVGAIHPTSRTSNFISNSVGEVTWYTTTETLSADSVFAVTDGAGVRQLRKNVKSTVTVVGADLSFRNPAHFMGLEDVEPRDAHHETDAALDHYFYHSNTAPFLATRFVQRFGISNPSPGYIERIVTAFRTGLYSFTGGGSIVTYGSGEYGDLAATIACVLLDREARAVVLDADPAHGSLKEPLLKVIGLMRSMQFKLFEDVPFVDFDGDISASIGQMAHEIPSVFSFFLPEHKPSGAVSQASLVAPEAQVTTGPRIISLLNGLLSLIKYGLDPCYDGLGTQSGSGKLECGKFQAGNYDRSAGRLTYAPLSGSAEDITNELATLMTAGRLSSESRQTIQQVFSAESNSTLALIKAQGLIATAPEFHSTNIVRKSGETRSQPETPPPSTKPYKAVVYVLLSGGFDSYNMLAPHTCTATNASGQTLLEQYYAERTSIAITGDERSRIVDANGQPCEQFVVHEDLEIVERLYKEGDLAFFANAGVLNAPVTKENYNAVTKTNLFAHNTMQEEAQKIDPFNRAPGTGVLGRMCDVLTDKGFNAKPITLADATVATVGVPGNAVAPLFVSAKGTSEFNPTPRREAFDPRPYMNELNDATELQSSVFGETWSSRLNQALSQNEVLNEVLSTVQLTQSWVGGKYTERMKTASNVILSHGQRGDDRDVIFVELSGWDHHQMVKSELSLHFGELNQALTYFKNEMHAQGHWDDVSLVITSDFGRTLTANSGEGSDHAWGGNYFVMGGSVKGGQIHGQYPEDITEAGPVNIGRGRLIPTTSWESILNSVVEWMGVEDTAGLDYCLPNRANTDTKLFTKAEVFEN